jgi:hypothetical protein
MTDIDPMWTKKIRISDDLLYVMKEKILGRLRVRSGVGGDPL